jgi:L-aspartate oxidase
VVLATGGLGQLFLYTTNPREATADGLAMAARAGARLVDLEFVQFHPTALHTPLMPRPLLSEALRGEGAVLRDADGVAFMTGLHPLADLAPRDVVARAVHERMQATGEGHVWLDATMIDDFEHHFPTIWFSCMRADLDPTEEWLPVAPAAHYLSGGAVTDLDGATTLEHLWACGEVACSGVHGANRLASNSLLDGLVFGRRVVEAILAGKVAAEPTGAMTGVLDLPRPDLPRPDLPRPDLRRPVAAEGPPEVVGRAHATDPSAVRAALQRAMSSDCGVVRDADGLRRASATLRDLARRADELWSRSIAGYEVIDLLRVSQSIVASATARTESRGSHTRRDFPGSSEDMLGRFVSRGGPEPVFVALAAVVRGGR